MAHLGDRFTTGDECDASGVYLFDGYADGTWTPPPTKEEWHVNVTKGETFPPIKSANKRCVWKFIRPE